MNTNYIILMAILFFAIVIIGSAVMIRIVNRKWGYTPEREQELEKQAEQEKFTGSP